MVVDIQKTGKSQCPVREVLDQIGDAWTVVVLLELTKGPCRFNALCRSVRGISQRMLTVTLRQLERNGLVERVVFPCSPPRVEYSLTELGASLQEQVHGLHLWAVDHQKAIHTARAEYDERGE
ncbi:MAG: winged helix-turn-helix transcriptional regulator [Methyloligellaceae bacterium]